ncbi:MAG: lactate dehydrogenase [Oscillospiraceae bacterium]|nr:lactate dehydrogenase [Oscillospiraceae bacterium]
MKYYQFENHVFVSETALPYPEVPELPESEEIIYLFRRPPLAGREMFAVSGEDLLTAGESVETLACSERNNTEISGSLRKAVREQRVRAVNGEHPRWKELLAAPKLPEKCRVHLLALGDVGSTLALGLRLLGRDVISEIGICDLRPNVADRWEFELNQIDVPDGGGFPAVVKISPEELFACDVFLFCASRFVPDTAVKSGDVRMAQFELNRELIAGYARRARDEKFQGMFCVVSDPVDQLCRAVLLESNRDENGKLDFQGLFPHQVRGFGLGVMNARARYFAGKSDDPRMRAFLEDGRTFGPHGEGLVVANSISSYDGGISRELTERTKHANLEMREMGFKPYVAPALSSGALSLLLCLRGEWHCSSVFLDGIFMGARNRIAANGPDLERLPLPDALLARLRETAEQLRKIPG